MNTLDADIAMLEVNELAEDLYRMSGGKVEKGKTFSRHLTEYAEYCYQAAAVAYMTHQAERLGCEEMTSEILGAVTLH